MTGPRQAFTTVVDSRSYSRNSGATSCELQTKASGNSSVMMRRAACSCAGSRKLYKKTDGDSGDAGVAQNANGLAHRSLVERRLDAAIVAQPFRHFAAQTALDEHRRFVSLQIVKVRSLLPADLEKVAEAVAGEQAGGRTSMLDQRICRDGCPVAEIRDIVCLGAGACESLADPLCDGVRRIGGGRGHLPNREAAACLLKQADIGECAARIDPNAPGHPHASAGLAPRISGLRRTVA